MEKEKYYKISESDLRDLLYDSARLTVLDRDGVDNWQFYNESYFDFIAEVFECSVEEAEESDNSLAEVAEKWLENYEEIN